MEVGRPRFISRWKGASVSFAGRGHLERGLPCQDASKVLLDNVAKIIVVSDGAGSARYAEHGAAGAVEATVRTLQKTEPWADPEDVREQILAACKAEIAERANELACSESDLAATLAFAAVAQDIFVAGNLGDGVVAAFRGERPEILLMPARGEFANETVFLTSSMANQQFRVVRESLDDRDSFAIMSDGAAESLYQRYKDSLAPALIRIISWFEQETSSNVQDAIRISAMPMIGNRTMDDCSLAILKLVRLALDDLDGKNVDFQAEFLETKNKCGFRNRIKILECYKRNMHTSEMVETVGLSVQTIRKHRRILESLFI